MQFITLINFLSIKFLALKHTRTTAKKRKVNRMD